MSALIQRTPEQVGIPSAAVEHFLQGVREQNIELHSFVFARHGAIYAQGAWAPYSLHRNHMLFSLSKSFTSTAVGFAVQEGLLTVDDPVLGFFPEQAQGKSQRWGRLRVRHLLSMSTGHIIDASEKTFGRRDGNWVKGFFSVPLKKEPGTHFVYNTAATYMLSVIVQKLTGQRVLDYLTPRLFVPLGIEGATWEQCPKGYDTGGFGLMIKTPDIARFGQFLLQKGMWEGKQLLNPAWVDEASAKHVSNGPADGTSDWGMGYGYQFWRCIPEGVYRGDGAFGQYCVVCPDQDAVFAINSGIGDMQGVLTLLWQRLLPAMSRLQGRAGAEGPDQAEPLADDAVAHASLQTTIEGLKYEPQRLLADSALEAQWNGKTILLENNPLHMAWLKLAFDADSCNLAAKFSRRSYGTLSTNAARGGTVTQRYGRHNWVAGTNNADIPHETAASFTWEDARTLRLTQRDVSAPFVTDLRLCFEGDAVEVSYKMNVGFGPTEPVPVKGKVKK